jgi:chromosome segregation ATPase
VLNQIQELRERLKTATRVQAKYINQQIHDLESEKNKILREMQKIEDQIEKRQIKIERLNEQAHKTSIKTSMIGKDADKNEYWFFKEEPGKLFVKKFEEI